MAFKAANSPAVADIDAAWAAGILDGEGCVRLSTSKSGRKVWIGLSVVNTDPRIVRRFRSIFGVGAIHARTHHKADWRPQYEWVSSCREAAAVLQILLPHLTSKRDQAEIAITIQQTMRETITLGRAKGGAGRGRVVPLETMERRRALGAELKALKRRVVEDVV